MRKFLVLFALSLFAVTGCVTTDDEGDTYPDIPESEDPKPVPPEDDTFQGKGFGLSAIGDKLLKTGNTLNGLPYRIGGCRKPGFKDCDCSGLEYQRISVRGGLFSASRMRGSAQAQHDYLTSLIPLAKVVRTPYDVNQMTPGATRCYMGGYPGNSKFIGHVWTYAGKDAKGRHTAHDASPRPGVSRRIIGGWFLNKSYQRGCLTIINP